MNTSDEKVIELSRTKILLLVLGAGAFVALGLWMLSLDSATIQAQRRFNNPMLFRGLGVAAVVFFGLAGAFGVRKLLDDKPGLVFSSAGILDNSSAASAGLVPWQEITGFGVFEVHRQKLLIVKVADPDRYIEVGNAMKRRLNRANHRMCGSPIAITSSSLRISFGDLQRTAGEYFAKYGKGA